MKLRLIFVMVCLMLAIQTASAGAIEQVTNGGFETGNFTGWSTYTDSASVVNPSVTTAYKYDGNYSACLQAGGDNNEGVSTSISQSIDLSGVSNLTFYLYKPSDTSDVAGGTFTFKVLINGTSVFSTTAAYTAWTLIDLNVSGWTGQSTVTFQYAGSLTATSGVSDSLYVDDVSALAAAYDIQFNFVDATTEQPLNNVTLNYSVDGVDYVNTFNSGDVVTVYPNSTILVYEASKAGYESDLEKQGYSLYIYADTDKSVTIYFYPLEQETRRLCFYFINNETGFALNDVLLDAYVYSGGVLVNHVNQTVDSGFILAVPVNSTVVYTASKEGFQSELEIEGVSGTIFDVASDQDIYIRFYPQITQAELHFYFFDAKQNALIPGVNFTLSCNGTTIDSGTYDYEKVYQVDRWKTYVWQASKTGYIDASGEIYVGSDQDIYTIYVELAPVVTPSDEVNNTIASFLVKNSLGYPVSGAAVTLYGTTRLTNQQGYAYFEVAKNGSYAYIVQASGYASVSGTVEVGIDPVLVEVTLTEIYITPTPTGTAGESGGIETGGAGNTYQPTTSQQESLNRAIDTLYSNAPTLVNLAVLVAVMSFLSMITRTLGRRRR